MHAKRAKIAKNGDCVPFGIATALPAPHANKGSAFGLDCSLSGQAFAVSAATLSPRWLRPLTPPNYHVGFDPASPFSFLIMYIFH